MFQKIGTMIFHSKGDKQVIEVEQLKSELFKTIVEAFEAKMRMILKDKSTPENIELLLEKHPDSMVYKDDSMNVSFDIFLTGVEVGVVLQGS